MAQQRYIIDARSTKVGVYKTGDYPDFADTPVVVFTKGTYRLSVNGEVITVSSEAGETIFPAFSLIDDIYQAGGASPITMPTTWAEWYALVEGWFSVLAQFSVTTGDVNVDTSGLATETTLAEAVSKMDAVLTEVGYTTDAASNTQNEVTNLNAKFAGLLPFKLISAASTNATVIKAVPGKLGTLTILCTGAAVRYAKLYNKGTAPTVGTDVPVLTIPIPAATTGAGFSITFPNGGLSFATGIGIALTTGSADNDTNAVSAGEVIVAATYY